MIKTLSQLPPLSAVRPSSVFQDADLLEMSLSGSPSAVYDLSGVFQGAFSASGWASAKIQYSEFVNAVIYTVSGAIFASPEVGTFHSTGTFVPINFSGQTKYIQLFNKV
jgi:hypothetical protein